MNAPALNCSHRPPCPGCPRFGEALAGGLALDRLAELAKEAQVVPTLTASGDARGYRYRARLAVRGRAGSPKLGIFQEHSHRIVDIPHCVVQHPLINDVAALCKQAIRDTRTEPYAEAPHRGLVRYIQVVVERATERVQLVVVANCEERAPLDALLARLQELLGERLQGLFWSSNAERTNVILGAHCEKVAGGDAVCEQLAGTDVFFPPDAFGQANLRGYERIVKQIGTWVADGADVLELYAGTGAIGLSVLPRSARVRFCEVGEGSLHGLRMGIETLAPALQARAQLLAGPVALHAALARRADTVIADPPRKGLDADLLSALASEPPSRFIYLSCGLDSYLSDARQLLASGMRLTQLFAYDLFPFTEHVETLSLFERSDR